MLGLSDPRAKRCWRHCRSDGWVFPRYICCPGNSYPSQQQEYVSKGFIISYKRFCMECSDVENIPFVEEHGYKSSPCSSCSVFSKLTGSSSLGPLARFLFIFHGSMAFYMPTRCWALDLMARHFPHFPLYSFFLFSKYRSKIQTQ